MMNLTEFNETILHNNPKCMYVVRFEQNTPNRCGNPLKTYFNAVVFLSPYTEELEVILEDYSHDIYNCLIVGWVDIKEINLAVMKIIADSIRRRFDI